jgi:hypothetical protein
MRIVRIKCTGLPDLSLSHGHGNLICRNEIRKIRSGPLSTPKGARPRSHIPTSPSPERSGPIFLGKMAIARKHGVHVLESLATVAATPHSYRAAIARTMLPRGHAGNSTPELSDLFINHAVKSLTDTLNFLPSICATLTIEGERVDYPK